MGVQTNICCVTFLRRVQIHNPTLCWFFASPQIPQLPIQPRLAVQRVLHYKPAACRTVFVRQYIFWHPVKIKPLSFKTFHKRHTSMLSYCQYIIHSTLFSLFPTPCVSYRTSQTFLFQPRGAGKGDVAAIIHTHILPLMRQLLLHRGCLCLLQHTIIYCVHWWSPVREGGGGAEAEIRCPVGGGLCPVSIQSFLHRFMQERKGSQDTCIDLSPSPASLSSSYPPSNHPRA